MKKTGDITQLLQDWVEGDAQALERLMERIYDELRRQAAAQLRRERPDHTLQTSALVNHARDRVTVKRGGGVERLPLDEAIVVSREHLAECLVVDEALQVLARDSPWSTSRVSRSTPTAIATAWRFANGWSFLAPYVRRCITLTRTW